MQEKQIHIRAQLIARWGMNEIVASAPKIVQGCCRKEKEDTHIGARVYE
jgi:hypothetical protein